MHSLEQIASLLNISNHQTSQFSYLKSGASVNATNIIDFHEKYMDEFTQDARRASGASPTLGNHCCCYCYIQRMYVCTYMLHTTCCTLGWVGHKTHPSFTAGVTKRLSAGHSAQL